MAVLLAARLVLVAMASFWDAPPPLPLADDHAPAAALPEVEYEVEARVIAEALAARDAAAGQAADRVQAAFDRARAQATAYRAFHHGVAGHYAELRAAAARALGWPVDPPVQAVLFLPLAADLALAAAEADRALTGAYLARATVLAPEAGVNDAADDPLWPDDPPLVAEGLAFADFGWHAGPAFRTAAGALVLWFLLARLWRRLAAPGLRGAPGLVAGALAGALAWVVADAAFLAADDRRFGDGFAQRLADVLDRQQAAVSEALARGLDRKAQALAAATIRDMRDENG